jgi:hypothetical protein
VPSQLAFVTLFELLLAAASFTVLLDACIEHLDFDRVLLGKWVGRSINEGKETCSESHRHGTGAIEFLWCFDEGLATVSQVGIGR